MPLAHAFRFDMRCRCLPLSATPPAFAFIFFRAPRATYCRFAFRFFTPPLLMLRATPLRYAALLMLMFRFSR